MQMAYLKLRVVIRDQAWEFKSGSTTSYNLSLCLVFFINKMGIPMVIIS